jgi:hypothetical protein
MRYECFSRKVSRVSFVRLGSRRDPTLLLLLHRRHMGRRSLSSSFPPLIWGVMWSAVMGFAWVGYLPQTGQTIAGLRTLGGPTTSNAGLRSA